MPAPAARPADAVVHPFPYERMSDRDLVRHVARGDEEALRAVWYRYSEQVRRTLLGCLGSDHVVDDLLQEVFLSFSQAAARITEPERLRGYLVGAALRQARHVLRTRRRRRYWLAIWSWSRPTDTLAPVQPRDALRALDGILDLLPTRLREAFVLRYVEGLSPPEVAQIRSVSLATAKRDIARARARVLLHAGREPALARYLGTTVGSSDDGQG